MFCRFGSFEDSRPVAAVVCENTVCTRPVCGFTCCGSVSTYVDLILVSSRQRSTAWTAGCACRSGSSAFASVVQPVAVLRDFGRPSSSNSTCESCCGEPIWNSCPTAS